MSFIKLGIDRIDTNEIYRIIIIGDLIDNNKEL